MFLPYLTLNGYRWTVPFMSSTQAIRRFYWQIFQRLTLKCIIQLPCVPYETPTVLEFPKIFYPDRTQLSCLAVRKTSKLVSVVTWPIDL